MLDQNTDRMWYVIGAVLVGAAIILVANGTIPEIFASVTDSFSSVSYNATNAIEEEFADNNIIEAHDLELYGIGNFQEVTLIDFDVDSEVWTLQLPVNPTRWSRGLKVKASAVTVPYGSKFTTRYDVFVSEGVDEVYVNTDINNSYVSSGIHGSLNDNDNVGNREYGIYENGRRKVLGGGMEKAIPVKSGEWNTIWYSYENTSERNTKKEDLYDYSNIGTTNPLDKPLTIKIRNVYGSLVNENGEIINEEGEEM